MSYIKPVRGTIYVVSSNLYEIFEYPLFRIGLWVVYITRGCALSNWGSGNDTVRAPEAKLELPTFHLGPFSSCIPGFIIEVPHQTPRRGI